MGCLKLTYSEEKTTSFLGVWRYGARMYDAAIARFTTIDPMAETFNNQSPYLYAYNNPVRFTDYMGMNAEDKVKEEEQDPPPEQQNMDEQQTNEPENGGDTEDGGDDSDGGDDNEDNSENENSEENTEVDESEDADDPKYLTKAALPVAGLCAVADGPFPFGEIVGASILTFAVVHDATVKAVDYFAHKKKKQSSGKSGLDRHDAQYTHGGKNRPKNPNQRKGAEGRRTKGKRTN
jgi:RHS repeat-associated protein